MSFFFLKKKRNVLVLSSGSARGLAHLGVLRFFIERGIEFDAIVGSSIGAIIGAYYALHKEIDGLIDFALEIDWKRLLQALDMNIVNIGKGGLVSGEKSVDLLKRVFADATFEDLKLEFAAIATKLDNGKSVILKQGQLLSVLRASYSIPGIFVPVFWEGSFLIDGGVSSPVPIFEARSLWGDNIRVWAVNVLSSPPRMNHKSNTVWDVISSIYGHQDKYSPSILDVLTQSIFIMESSIAIAQANFADIMIAPDTSNIHFMDFTTAKDLVSVGYHAAAEALT